MLNVSNSDTLRANQYLSIEYWYWYWCLDNPSKSENEVYKRLIVRMATFSHRQSGWYIRQNYYYICIITGKPQTTNFKSFIHTRKKRDDGRIVTSVQIFCMCILQQNVISLYTKNNSQSMFVSLGSNLARDSTLCLTLRNSPQWKDVQTTE